MNYRIVFIIAQFLFLTACNQSLVIESESDVPTPLVTQIPLNIGVYYDAQFRNHVYAENTEERQEWAIKSGASQVALFDSILPSMFNHVRQVNGSSDNSGNDLDAILVPSVEEMQFALPRETHTELYEVWIKYKIQLHGPNGDLIAAWPLTAYGKSTTEFMKSRDEGLLVAMNNAFRDAGAKFALNFSRYAEVKQWLASNPDVCNGQVTQFC